MERTYFSREAAEVDLIATMKLTFNKSYDF